MKVGRRSWTLGSVGHLSAMMPAVKVELDLQKKPSEERGSVEDGRTGGRCFYLSKLVPVANSVKKFAYWTSTG